MSSDTTLQVAHAWIDSGDGWQLELRRYGRGGRTATRPHPLLMVPGYAMNSYILAYHPTSRSMVGYLVDQGFEVWTTNMRGQGEAHRGPHTSRRYGLGELALVDLPAVLRAVRERTNLPDPAHIDVVGCSLGASVVYAYLAHHPHDHGIGSVVAVGGPLRWVAVHPAMKVASASPPLVGLIPITGTRAVARRLLPFAGHFPRADVHLHERRPDRPVPPRPAREHRRRPGALDQPPGRSLGQQG